MNTVYNLIMIDMESSYNDHFEKFNIGFFSCREKAETAARKYLNEVDGFKNYNITYQIIKKRLIGCNDSLKISELFIVYGWNINEEYDDVDNIESDCYTTKQEAEQKLNDLKLSNSLTEWCIDKYIIDECYWQEGFVKEYS